MWNAVEGNSKNQQVFIDKLCSTKIQIKLNAYNNNCFWSINTRDKHDRFYSHKFSLLAY